MEKIEEYLLDNLETLKELVNVINWFDGSLNWLDYQVNDEEFFEVYFNKKDDVARAICYGNYKYMDDYVKFNVYGNLESCSSYDYEEELKEYIVEIIDALEECLKKDKDYILNSIYDDDFKKMIGSLKC